MKSFTCTRPIAQKLVYAFASIAVFSLSHNTHAADAYAPSAISQIDAKLRPSDVPVDYVITPDGFYAPSCVQHMQNGETVLGDGSIQTVDGQVRKPAACTRPHYRFDGARIEPNGAFFPSPIHTGQHAVASRWVEAAYADYSDRSKRPVGRLSASWKVPGNPTNSSGQSLFFLIEVEQQGIRSTALKPVLSYNGFGDANWKLSTWTSIDGSAYFSDPINVDEGDLIVGSVHCEKANNCDTWTVEAVDMSKKDPAPIGTFQNVAAGGNASLILGGSLEVAGVSHCDQLPPSSPFAFWNIFLDTTSFSPINASWRPAYSGISLPCNFGVATNSNTPGSVFLSY